MRRGLILNAAVSVSDSSAEALFERGLSLLASGVAAQAAGAFRAAIAADPQHVQAHYGLVRSLREAGRLERSIAAALALTVLTPHDFRAHAELAVSLRAAGHTREAEAAEARARMLQWKNELESAPAGEPVASQGVSDPESNP